jgi:predicted nucleic acid-binding protein
MLGEAMNIYLDTSALNRIFDDQSQPRIFLEASAMLLVFGLIEKRIISIVSSDVLVYENSRNPYSERQIFVTSVLRKARVIQTLNDSLAKRAQEIEMLGIKGVDALHLACAERLKPDYFVTCDDRMIRKYTGMIVVVNPVELTMHVLQQVVDNAGS